MAEKLPFLKRFIKTAPADEGAEDEETNQAGEDSGAEAEPQGAASSDRTDAIDASEHLEELEDAPEPQWKTALRKQLPFLSKLLDKIPASKVASAAKGDKTAVDVKSPAAQKQKIIRVVIGVVIAYAVYDTVLKPADDGDVALETPEETPAEPKPKKNRKPKPEPGAATDPAVATDPVPATDPATPPTEPTPATDPVAVTPDPTLATDPTPPVSTEPAPVTDSAPAPVTETPPPVVEGGVATDITTVDPDGDDDPDATSPVEGTAPEDVPPPPPTLGIPEDGEAPTEPSTETPDVVGGGEKVPPGPETGADPAETPDMTEQILRDLEKQVQGDKEGGTVPAGPYVGPPDYENFGRGLVYNCQGKHWACIDGASYSICQQNYGSLKADGKPKECYPDSVYQTEKSCVWMQKERITAGTKTDFCQ